LGHVISVVLVVEKRTECDERDGHGRAGSVQQYFATQFVDERSSYECGHEIYNTHYNRAQVFIDGASRFLNINKTNWFPTDFMRV